MSNTVYIYIFNSLVWNNLNGYFFLISTNSHCCQVDFKRLLQVKYSDTVLKKIFITAVLTYIHFYWKIYVIYEQTLHSLTFKCSVRLKYMKESIRCMNLNHCCEWAWVVLVHLSLCIHLSSDWMSFQMEKMFSIPKAGVLPSGALLVPKKQKPWKCSAIPP